MVVTKLINLMFLKCQIEPCFVALWFFFFLYINEWQQVSSEGVKIYIVTTVSIRRNMMQGGCKALFKKLYFTFCSSQTARLNHRRMFQQIYFAVFLLPSRDYTEYRTKSSALTFLLKPLQSSSTCLSSYFEEKHLVFTRFGSSQQRGSDPLQNTVHPHPSSCTLVI